MTGGWWGERGGGCAIKFGVQYYHISIIYVHVQPVDEIQTTRRGINWTMWRRITGFFFFFFEGQRGGE